MRSETSLFNAAVYRKHLSRLWPLVAGYTVFLFLALFQRVMTGYAALSPLTLAQDAPRVDGLLLSGTVYGWPVLFMLYAIAIAMVLCGPLYSARQAVGIHALPLRREAHFTSALLAGLTCIAGPNLLLTLLAAIPAALQGALSAALPTWLLAATLEGLFFLSLALLCAHVTGHFVALPLLAIIFNFFFPVLEVVLRQYASRFIYGLAASGDPVTLPLSPCFYLVQGSFAMRGAYGDMGPTVVSFAGWGYLAALAAVSALLLALALLLYRKRPIESAGDVVSHPVLRPVFKYAFAGGCAIVLGFVFYGLLFSYIPDYGQLSLRLAQTLSITAGGLIGLLAAEMMLHKTFRVWATARRGLAVVGALLLGLGLILSFDLPGLARRLPDADSLREAELSVGGARVCLSEPDTLARLLEINAQIVDRREANQADLTQDDPLRWSCSITYTTHSGRVWERAYTLLATPAELAQPESPISRVSALINQPQTQVNTLERCQPYAAIEIYADGAGITLEGSQADRVFAALLQEAQAGRLGRFDPSGDGRAQAVPTQEAGEFPPMTFYITIIPPSGTSGARWYSHYTLTAENQAVQAVLDEMGLWQQLEAAYRAEYQGDSARK